MSHASDWGVPDWMRPQDYPATPGPVAMTKWTWEFLRRNWEFREFWRFKVEPFTTAKVRTGENRWQFWPHYREMQERFGIVDLRSPRQSSCIPAFSDCVTEFYPAPALIYESVAQPPPLVPLSEHAIAFVVDPILPIDGQLKVIRKLAVDAQRALKKSGLRPRRAAKTSGNYRMYLRILDAEDAEARRSDIEDILFPHIERYSPEDPRSKVFNNARSAARRLRDGGYRALALRSQGRPLK